MSNILGGLKEMCNKIVGYWYCDDIQQQFIFHFNDTLLRESKLVIINTETFETEYGVAIMPSREPHEQHYYFFDVGKFNKRYYEILELTKDKLVIREFYMIVDVPPSDIKLTYVRKTDTSIADEILKEIDLD